MNRHTHSHTVVSALFLINSVVLIQQPWQTLRWPRYSRSLYHLPAVTEAAVAPEAGIPGSFFSFSWNINDVFKVTWFSWRIRQLTFMMIVTNWVVVFFLKKKRKKIEKSVGFYTYFILVWGKNEKKRTDHMTNMLLNWSSDLSFFLLTAGFKNQDSRFLYLLHITCTSTWKVEKKIANNPKCPKWEKTKQKT